MSFMKKSSPYNLSSVGKSPSFRGAAASIDEGSTEIDFDDLLLDYPELAAQVDRASAILTSSGHF